MLVLPLGPVLVACVAFLLAAYLLLRRRHPHMPPGPPSLPLIGSLLSLAGDDVRERMMLLRDRYGDVFTVDMGTRRTVILASYDVIKEALVKNAHAFSSRPQDLFFITDITHGNGIVSSNGSLWRDQRKFAHSVFRDFGIGRPVFEERIHEELAHLIQELEGFLDQPYDVARVLQMSVSNVINNVTFGQRYEYDDIEFIKYMNIMDKNFQILGNSGALTVFPFLKYLPGDLFDYKNLLTTSDYMIDMFKQQIITHRKTHTDGVIHDFIDAYLNEISSKEDKYSTFSDQQLVHVIGDLFGAGTETTTTTLRWAFLYMLRQPDVQRRVHHEIDTVLGSGVPAMKDRLRMPYTEAVLLEVQRMGDIVPLGVPHICDRQTDIAGYTIPAGVTVMTLLYAAHRDDKVWNMPYLFDPGRFLDDEGALIKDDRLIPFSMGRRVCLGESLARMELFLFFTCLMQRFSFSCPPGEEPPPEDSIVSITNGPKPFRLVIQQRL